MATYLTSEDRARLVTQVAVEAAYNAPAGYSRDTLQSILDAGEEAGISDLYLNKLQADLDAGMGW